MFVSAPPPPVLTLAQPAEISMQRGTESQPLKLAQYQIIRATVAEGGLEKVLLNVRQQQLSAETRVPLKTGQQLNLQVVATKPRVHLRIMEAAELRHLFRLLNNLGDNVRLLPLLKNLQQLTDAGRPASLPTGGQAASQTVFGNPAQPGQPAMATNALPADMQAALNEITRLLQAAPGKLSGNHLAGLWEKLGLNLEALLAEEKGAQARIGLKSLLFTLAGRLEQQGIFPEGLDRVLDQFNLYQLCRYRLAQENIFFLPLPFPFLEQGYLLAERETYAEDEDEADEDRPEQSWKMTLHLKLSVLGALEIKLLFEDQALRLRVLCDSREKAALISEALPRLQERLSTVTLHSFSVDTGAQDPVTSLVKRLAPDGEHFLEAQV